MSDLGLHLISVELHKDTKRIDYMERAGYNHHRLGKHLYFSWEKQCHYNETFVEFILKSITLFVKLAIFPFELVFRLIQQLFRIVPSIDIVTKDTKNKTDIELEKDGICQEGLE